MPLALTVKSVCGSRRGPVVRRLRGGVDDQLEVAARCARTGASTPSASRMSSSTSGTRRELARSEALGRAGGRGLGPEEVRAHVVLDADHVEARSDEVRDGLGADQAAGAGDDRGGHRRGSLGAAERGDDDAPRARAIQRGDVREHRRAAPRRGPPVGQREQPASSRRGRSRTSPGPVGAGRADRRPRCRSARGTARSSRAATASTSRPPPTLTVPPGPVVGVGELLVDAGRRGRRRGAGRAPACPSPP